MEDAPSHCWGVTKPHHHLGSHNGVVMALAPSSPSLALTVLPSTALDHPPAPPFLKRQQWAGCLPGCAAVVSKKEERRDTWSESNRSAPQVPQCPSHPSITASQGGAGGSRCRGASSDSRGNPDPKERVNVPILGSEHPETHRWLLLLSHTFHCATSYIKRAQIKLHP